jgi:hypothetical protein
MNTPSRLFATSLLAAAFLPGQEPGDTPNPARLEPVRPPSASTEIDATAPVANGTRMTSLRTPIHTAEHDNGLAYGTWAAGDDYKVSFHDGMAFVPYLGASYPVTQTLRWRTTSAKVGEVELVTGAPQHEHADFRYEYRFGAITEAYDVLAEGLEQTFVLSTRPAAGDLVIRGAVDSLLQSRKATAANQSLTFRDADGHAIVEYGRAVAFDANGLRIDVTTEHADGMVTLTVPGNWLAAAALPIVVDPLLTRVQLATWGTATFGQVQSVDIARDDEATSANVMVAYARAASATDSDLWLRVCNDDFTSNVLIYSDITTTWDTDQATCCFVGGADRFVSVFRRFFPTLTPTVSRLRCKVHDSGSTTLTTNVGSVTPASGLNDWRPDVGGIEAFTSGTNAFVVFQREDNGVGNNFANSSASEIFGCLLDATTANGTFGTSSVIAASSFSDSERPSITQVASGVGASSWACVFQRYSTLVVGAEDWDLVGKLIAGNGTVSSGSFSSDIGSGGPLTHQLGPVVSGRSGRYAVVFTAVDQASVAFQTGLITGKEVWMERFDWTDGAASPTGDYPPVLLRSNTDRRWEATGNAYDTDTRSHWMVGFRTVPPGSGSLYYARCGYDGNVTEGAFSTLYGVSGHQAIGGSVVYDNDNDNFLFGYGVDDGTTTLPVFGHAVTYATPTPWSTFGIGTACSTATLSWTGSQQIGSQFGQANVNGAPATGIHFLILSLGTVNVPVINPAVFPGCRLLVAAAGIDYLGYFPPQIGSNTSYPLPLPPFLGSQTLYFQDWYLDGPFLYSTERLNLPIIK